MNIAWPRLLKHRSDFIFSFQAIAIDVDQTVEITISDPTNGENIPLNARAFEKAARGSFLGSIEALILRDFSVVVCVLALDGLVAVLDCNSGIWNPQNLVEIRGPGGLVVGFSCIALHKFLIHAPLH